MQLGRVNNLTKPFDDQDRDASLRSGRRVVYARFGPHSSRAFIWLEDRSEGVSIDRTRQGSGGSLLRSEGPRTGGQGAVSIFASGKVRLKGHKTAFDGRGLGAQFVVQMSGVGEDVVFRQRIAELACVGEAREGSQIPGIGPQGVMSDAALIAAGVDEGGVGEMAHSELLKWCSGSSARVCQLFEIACPCGNDHGPPYYSPKSVSGGTIKRNTHRLHSLRRVAVSGHERIHNVGFDGWAIE